MGCWLFGLDMCAVANTGFLFLEPGVFAEVPRGLDLELSLLLP